MANTDEDIATFVGITASSEEVARGFIEIANNDVMQAVTLFFENPDLQSSFAAPAPASSSAAARPAAGGASSASRTQGISSRPGEVEVIQIDSDDDIPIGSDDDEGANARAIARSAQEDEDAAMAQRLQEEMYGGGGPAAAGGAVDEDGVRAPIGRTTETLVAPSYAGGGMMDDDLDDQIMQQIARRRQAAGEHHSDSVTDFPLTDLRFRTAPRPNPFAQSIWDDPEAPAVMPGNRSFSAAAAGSEGSGQQSRAQRLAELFRPPYDLMSNLPWDQAREEGKEEKKWILVNVQDMTDFNCQTLNRDIWKNKLVASLARESFILLQYSKNDPRAQEYQTFYFNQQAQENPDNFPHVSIIDPRTGEQVKVWSGRPFPSAQEFHAQLVEFLDRYSLKQNSKNPVSKQKRPQQPVDVDRMTEEEMLAMAMQNSLESTGNGGESASGSGSRSASGSGLAVVHDPDELTKSVELDKGKGKEVATEDAPMEDTPAPSAWHGIAATRPHTEPANDPNTTTRIQFKHATGRVIRRFNLRDPVRTIYEWLKNQPLEGKEGVEFELKTVPQSHDLLEVLDMTIAEAGLKNATVMMEFIE